MHVFTVLLVSVASLSHLYLGCCWHGGNPQGAVCVVEHDHAHGERPAETSQQQGPHRHHCSQHGRCWWSSGPRQQELLQVAIVGNRGLEGLLIVQQAASSTSVPQANVSFPGTESQARLGVFLC